MDTDSLYLAVAAKSLDDCVIPRKLEHYFRNKSEWFPSVCRDAHVQDYVACRLVGCKWFASEPCSTPGLFGVEWEGDDFVGLCSKTYYCFGPTDKFNTKGLNEKQKTCSWKSHKTGEAASEKNHGFRVRNPSIYTYIQERSVLTYFYLKRRVQAHGVTTLPCLM